VRVFAAMHANGTSNLLLPVQQPTKFEFVMTMQHLAVQALGDASGTFSKGMRNRPSKPPSQGAADQTPVPWSSIEAGIRPDAFTMKSPFRARSVTANRPVPERA
jgi:hypothetical protein